MSAPKLDPLIPVFCLAAWAATTGVVAQAPPGLEIDTYAGLTITGSVGAVYSIDYTADVAETNDNSAWRSLEFLQLPANPFLWIDKSASATEKRFYRAVVFAAPTNMVFIPPGTFRMGSATNEGDRQENEGPQTEVILSQGFWMGKYEVSQGEYLEVIGNNPSYFNGIQGEGEPWETDFGIDLNRPVESVFWDDVVAFCAALTERELAMGRIRPGSSYRLPTEAEWEYACRAWTSTRFSFGDDPGYTNLIRYAWYGDLTRSGPHPVGQKVPNQWGLYDMHGNVYEWCQDRFGTYPGGASLDPQGPAEEDRGVVRSGSWDSGDWSCRSACRWPRSRLVRTDRLGFRVVLAPVHPGHE
jgi:formylglycine-generating enzyme required for sulfatase activity